MYCEGKAANLAATTIAVAASVYISMLWEICRKKLSMLIHGYSYLHIIFYKVSQFFILE